MPAPGALALGLVLVLACGDGDGGGGNGGENTATTGALKPEDFQTTVDNRFFPLRPGETLVYEGEETDPDTGEKIKLRVESKVLEETDTVASIEVTVVEVKDFENGELVESTLDYYAQHRDGTVYYLGERVDDYENGEVAGHSGQWLAGEGDNQPGIFMPAEPKMGDAFEQERAPGVAEDRSKVVAVDESVETPAGSFSGCIKTEDLDPISDTTEFKFYCPDVGLVREEGLNSFAELISR